MGANGTATLDFGAFPGKSDASVAVTGQDGIVAGSLVEAWIRPADTTDHLHDEHLVETIRVVAGSIVAATGFTVYGFNTSQVQEPLEAGPRGGVLALGGTLHGGSIGYSAHERGGIGTRLYGQWSVAWVWN